MRADRYNPYQRRDRSTSAWKGLRLFTPDRRTCIVLASLIGAMTVASGLLLILEPAPVVPVPDISLSALDQPTNSVTQQIFPPAGADQLHNWKGIVIHDSGAMSGSAQSINEIHEALGVGTLGYHFVIHNGNGGPDGLRTDGPRWHRQAAGAYCGGADADLYNQHAIGVCLIGNFAKESPTEEQMQQLVKLVNTLQQRFDIASNRVWVQSGADQDATPGRHFPLARFQKQLLSGS